MPFTPRIAIIGAGPGGLTLARLLHVRGILSTLYEREPHRRSRSQGGTFDLHTVSGQQALKEAGLFEEFKCIARPEGKDMVFADKTGHRYINHTVCNCEYLLLDSLPGGAVKWGCSIRSVTKIIDDNSDKIGLQIETPSNGTITEHYDLVIGADGAWSKVRPLLTTTQPHYSSISGLDLTIRDIDSKHPSLSGMVGRGSYVALSDKKALIAQRNGDNSIRVYVNFKCAESWLADTGINFSSNPSATKDFLSQQFHDWAPELQDLFLEVDDDPEGIVARSLYMFPVDHTWEHVPGATLLGDAAHLMTPFAGEGVNLAMLDALELSSAIAAAALAPAGAANYNDGGRGTLDTNIRGYEDKMFTRSHTAMEETWHHLELFFAEDSPRGFVEEFQAMMARFGGLDG